MAKIRKSLKKRRYPRTFAVEEVAASAPPAGSGSKFDTATEQQLVPYDENLLERARTQWQFGDWDSLAKLERDTLQHHPDRAKLALLAAAGHLQQGNAQVARQFTRCAQDWGCSKKLISQILVAGVHNSLGRAAAVAGQEPRALKHFESAIAIGTPGSDARLLGQARTTQQLSQIGLTEDITDRLWLRVPGKGSPLIISESPGYKTTSPVNEFFDAVFVINLERRRDRLWLIDQKLKRLNIKYNIFRAIDGLSDLVISEYKNYIKDFSVPSDNGGISQIEYLTANVSDESRVRFLEYKIKSPAIRTPGAWALAKSYKEVLSICLNKQYESILIFEDDCIFHKDFNSIFEATISQLPKDWKILQLGSLQYNWNLCAHYSENLYKPMGAVVGAHAVGLRKEVINILLKNIDSCTMPFDIGPLHYACMEFVNESFVITPNIAIQRNSESDINSSDLNENDLLKRDETYKWIRADYL